jgi:nucleotide-binding universal stress UspA family protein
VINVRNILYATDFSPYSNQAYFHAVALAESHAASLIIAHVYTPGGAVPPDAGPDERAFWRGQLEQIRPVNPHIPVQHVLLEGDPAEEIIRYAGATRADLIVMGTHGRTGLERLLMGSVAEKVLRSAPCSVLVVKMPKAAPVVDKSDAAGAPSSA